MASFRVYASTYGVRLLATATAMAASILLARALGPAGRGDFTAFVAGVSLLVSLTGFGLSSSAIPELGARPDTARQTGTLLMMAAMFVAPVSLVCALFLRHFAPVPLEPGAVVLATLWPVSQLLMLNVQTAFLGLARYGWFNGLELGSRFASLFGVIVLVLRGEHSAFGYLAVLFSAETFMALVGVVALGASRGLWAVPDRALVRRVLGSGLRAYVTLLPGFVLVRSDILLLRAYSGATETGIYSVAAQIVTMMWILPQVCAQILFSHLPRAEDRAHHVSVVTGATFWLLVTGCICAIVIGQPVIGFVFGRKFTDAYRLLLLLLPGALALGVETTVVQYFNATGFPLFIARYWLAALAANLAINLLLIPRYGATVAAISSSIGYAIITALVIRRFLKETRIPLLQLFRFPALSTLVRARIPA